MNNNQTNQQNNNQKSFHVDSRNGYLRFIKPVYYTVWTVVGVMVLTLLSIAVLGSGTWQENLNLSEAPVAQSAEQVAPQSQQPQQPQPQEPTQEQLACIADQLGDERLFELQQGAEANDPEEIAAIESCLLADAPAPEPSPEEIEE